jgi:diacylglycerol diphosphate phosphatase / phosphatidate phosphatase
MAFSAYRMVYASVWDFRFNHIPLTRYMPFTYNGLTAFDTAIWTRKAGWGSGEGASGGAPFDATAGLSGGMSGIGGSSNGHGLHRKPVGGVHGDNVV